MYKHNQFYFNHVLHRYMLYLSFIIHDNHDNHAWMSSSYISFDRIDVQTRDCVAESILAGNPFVRATVNRKSIRSNRWCSMRPCIIYNFRGITVVRERQPSSATFEYNAALTATGIANCKICSILHKQVAHAWPRRTKSANACSNDRRPRREFFYAIGDRKNSRHANRLETVQTFHQCAISENNSVWIINETAVDTCLYLMTVII